jgi:glycyl-tRNA synthetase beta chain
MIALEAIRSDPGFRALATSHKRIKNILKDQTRGVLDPRRLRDDAERRLHTQLEAALPSIEAAQRGRDYLGALREIARLGPGLDRFFKEVMVMADEPALRENRLALLGSIASLFLRVGDFSEIVLEGEPAAAAVRRTS